MDTHSIIKTGRMCNPVPFPKSKLSSLNRESCSIQPRGGIRVSRFVMAGEDCKRCAGHTQAVLEKAENAALKLST